MRKGLCWVMGCLLSVSAWASNPTDALESLLGHIQTMQANFTQTPLKSDEGAAQTTRGTMALQRPGLFRWDVKTPNEELIIADGTYVWMYNVALEQATKEKVDYQQAGSPAMLLSGTVQSLEADFAITRETPSNDEDTFLLKPKAEQGMFRALKLTFAAGELVQMDVSDNLGQESVIRFSKIQTNRSLDARLFRFSPSAGVDIVEN